MLPSFLNWLLSSLSVIIAVRVSTPRRRSSLKHPSLHCIMYNAKIFYGTVLADNLSTLFFPVHGLLKNHDLNFLRATFSRIYPCLNVTPNLLQLCMQNAAACAKIKKSGIIHLVYDLNVENILIIITVLYIFSHVCYMIECDQENDN